MQVKVQSIFNANYETVFTKVCQLRTLLEIARPILYIRPVQQIDLSKDWQTGDEYVFALKIFNIIPLGKHYIKVEQINKDKGFIQSREHGKLVKLWDHLITIKKKGDNRVCYTDIVEIKAGLPTIFIWLFAQVFYRHRQRRWRKLIQN